LTIFSSTASAGGFTPYAAKGKWTSSARKARIDTCGKLG